MPVHKKSLSKKKLFNKLHAVLAISLLSLSLLSIAIGYSMKNFALFSYALNSNDFSKSLVTNTSEWSLEKSGTVESITQTASGWVMQAGGNIASTHYARAKYKLPEKAGVAPTTFYMKATINLPTDFYTNQKVGFRIMNTDNFLTTLNGVQVGASSANELRTSVYINSDHTLRIKSQYDPSVSIEFFKLATPLPIGDHTLEFYGDVANVAPWYFKVDGKLIASGVNRLSPDAVPANERVITRMVAGIDGAAGQNSNPFSLTIKNFEISNFDPTALITPTISTTPTITPTPTTITNDNTPPEITITSPINLTKITSSVSIKTTASDTSGISKINIYFDGKLIKTCTSTTSCSYTYSTRKITSGTHKIDVYAYDKSPQNNYSISTVSVVK